MTEYGCTHAYEPDFCDGQPLGFAAYFHLLTQSGQTEAIASRLAYLRGVGMDQVAPSVPVWAPSTDIVCFPFVAKTLAPLHASELRMVGLDDELIEIDPDDPNRTNVYVIKKDLAATTTADLITELRRYRTTFLHDIDYQIMDLEERFHAAGFGENLDRGWEFKSLITSEGAGDQIRMGFLSALDDLIKRIQS